MKPVLLLPVLLVTLLVQPAFAQRPAIAPAPTPVAIDSTRQLRSASDSIPIPDAPAIRVGTSELTSESGSTLGADTVRVSPKQEAQIRKIIPRQATIRSLILPGLGQAYNRQYYKIPFIYAGFGVMGYLFVRYRGLARQAAEGYRLLLYGEEVVPAQSVKLPPGLAPSSILVQILIPAQYEKPDQVVIGSQIVQSVQGAKSGYDIFRRYRDLNTLLSVLLWGVNAVEANVAAHLKTFDLSDDISMRVEPSVIPMPGTGLVPGVRVALTFK